MDADNIDPAEAVANMGAVVERLRWLAAAFFDADTGSRFLAATESRDGTTVTASSASAATA